MNNYSNIWLVGTGEMAIEHSKVLSALGSDFIVIGRGSESSQKFQSLTGISVERGGIDAFLQKGIEIATHAIVAVGVLELFNVSKSLILAGVKNLLVEKPAGIDSIEIEQLVRIAKNYNARVFVAYNRRMYASVIAAQEIITNEGGVLSFNFEFTEWSHIISELKTSNKIKSRWFVANSTHVVDLAFYLAGKPDAISMYSKGGVPWHSASSIFAGSGTTATGALFSYHANWESAGRWSVEILTGESRLIFKPLERLQRQSRGSVSIEDVSIDDKLDKQFKPGLYIQNKKFIDRDFEGLCSLSSHLDAINMYEKMAGYRSGD